MPTATRARTVAALALLFALAVAVYWPITISGRYTWLESPDNTFQIRPWFDVAAREYHAGRLPLWDPYLWGGQSLIGQVLPGVVSPLNWPLFVAPLQDGHVSTAALHWYWVGIHWITAFFCYLLCRDLGASWWGSILGASIWGFAGYVGHATTPQFLTSAAWLPLILLFFARVWRGHRPLASAAALGAVLAAAFTSGHHNIPIYISVILGGFWLWYLLSRIADLRSRLQHALAFGIVFLLVSAVQVLPTVEYGRQTVRWAGAPEPQHWKDRIPYSVHAEYSLGARGVLGFVLPGLQVHAEPFLGIVAMTLVFAALRVRWKTRDVSLLALIALAGLLIALGRDTPLHRILYLAVPMVDKARYPAMCIAICQSALAPLAALGLDAARSAKTRSLFLVPLAFAVAILGIYGVLYLRHQMPGDYPGWKIAAVALVFAACLQFPKALPAAALVLFLAEVFIYPVRLALLDRPDSYARMIASQSDLADFFRRQPGWFRVEFDEDVIPYNFGDWYGVEQFGGYVAAMPVKTFSILGHQPTPRLFGIQYFAGKAPKNGYQTEVFQSRSGVKVFRDPAIAEPIWAVHPTPCAGDQFHVVSRTPPESVFEVDLACPGIVAVGDPTYTGWRAWVDGRRVRIQEIEGVVRGVPVEQGHHRIEFRYQPGSFYWGAGITVVGLVVMLFLQRRSA